MKNKRFLVYGWLNGESYDQDKPADQIVVVSAADESEAEDKGEKKFDERCEVIFANELS